MQSCAERFKDEVETESENRQVDCALSPALFEAAPRSAAAPQQSLKASFRFAFGLHAL